MFMLHEILKKEFAHSRKGEKRGTWFIYTLIVIIIPFTSSKTSNLCKRSINPILSGSPNYEISGGPAS